MDVSVELPYLINDADNHFVEPLDMYERYIDPKWRDKAVRFVTDERGRKTQLFAGRPSKNALTRDSVPQNEEDLEALASTAAPTVADEHAPKPGDGGARAPGMFLSRLNPYKDLTEAERKELIATFKEQEASWGNAALRLALMDEQGIEAALMFPGIVLTLEFEFVDDVDAIYANTQAFNRWIHDEVGYAYENRIFLPPYISLADVDLAVKEVERVIDEGAPVVQFMAGHAHGGRHNPRGGRSIADPVFDPVWARINEAGVRVATHLGPTDYVKQGADWSEDPEAVLRDLDALQWVLYWGDRPAMETVAGMILHNLFGRFPNVHVCIAEQGTVWLPYVLRKMDHAFLMGRGAKWGKLDRRPSDIFREHFVVPPFPEENVQRVVAEVGVEPIVFGSDFPHGEGLAYPRQYVSAQLSGIPDDHVRAIMRDNLARFLQLPA
jgi:predicted TIM-barrel fold metal-dependent hydrolase